MHRTLRWNPKTGSRKRGQKGPKFGSFWPIFIPPFLVKMHSTVDQTLETGSKKGVKSAKFGSFLALFFDPFLTKMHYFLLLVTMLGLLSNISWFYQFLIRTCKILHPFFRSYLVIFPCFCLSKRCFKKWYFWVNLPDNLRELSSWLGCMENLPKNRFSRYPQNWCFGQI